MSYNSQLTEELLIFGNNIQAIRKFRQYSLKNLAQLSNYDRICLSYVERGIQNLELNSAIKISKALDVAFPLLFSPTLEKALNKSNLRPYFDDDFLLIFVDNFKRHMLKQRRDHMYVYTQSGVQDSVISRIVSGREKNPTFFTLIAMAQASSSNLETMFTRNM